LALEGPLSRSQSSQTCTYNTSVHIQCKAIYDNTDVRDVNFMLSKADVFEVYTSSYSLAKCMMTVFLYKGVWGFFPGINLAGACYPLMS